MWGIHFVIILAVDFAQEWNCAIKNDVRHRMSMFVSVLLKLSLGPGRFGLCGWLLALSGAPGLPPPPLGGAAFLSLLWMVLLSPLALVGGADLLLLLGGAAFHALHWVGVPFLPLCEIEPTKGNCI